MITAAVHNNRDYSLRTSKMNRFMRVQLRKIEIDKWNESLIIKKDPGKDFILSWIQKNAGSFRNKWNRSLCKKCCFSDTCGDLVREKCDDFKIFADIK